MKASAAKAAWGKPVIQQRRMARDDVPCPHTQGKSKVCNEHHGAWFAPPFGCLGLQRFKKALFCIAVLTSMVGSASAQQVFTQNLGALEQPTGDRSYRPAVEVSGHGVILATGNKVEVEDDFVTQGEMPLHLRRMYNHHWSASGIFGKHWLSSFDYSLATSTSNAQIVLWIQRPDGRRIKFLPSGQADRWNEDKPSPVAYVVKSSDGTYTLHNEDRGMERYGANGFILERRNEQGVAWTFAYNGTYLQRVTHTSGRYIQFNWSGSQLVQVVDPAGNAYNYTYAANVFGAGQNRLAGAVLPGAPTTTVTYHYDDSRFLGGLTGKSYNGTRYSTYTYNSDGRVSSTELAGGAERFAFEYAGGSTTPMTPPPLPPAPGDESDDGSSGGGGWCEYQSGSRICFQPRFASLGAAGIAGAIGVSAMSSIGASAAMASTASSAFSVTETNPLGKKTIYRFENDRLVSVTRVESGSTPYAYRERQYDANGYEDVVTDFSDGLTDFGYDGHGHLISRVDAAGTSAARTTLYTWDEANNRVTTVTVSGASETTYSYAPDGRIARIDVKNISGKGLANAVQSTSYTYTKHANGLLASMAVDGPLPGTSDTITFSYSIYGDLLSVRNESGHTTTYSNYNALGLVGRIVGPNGDQTDYEYDGRGRTTAIKPIVNNAAQTTVFTYDGFGRLASVQTPDGRTRTKVYDAAWRVVEEYEREPGGTYARQLTAYNAASLATQVEVQRSAYPYSTQVIGNIDGVSANGAGGYHVSGWACTTGQDSPIDVHLYLGGAAGSGTFAGAFAANQASEAGVAAACAAQGGAYRFTIPLSDAMRDQHGGKAIYVHGISPAGKANDLIGASGAHLVPRLLPATAPTGLTAPAQSVSSSWTVSWSATARATRYRLEESANGGAWSIVHDGAEASKAISGKGGGTYGYRVSGCNEVGCGPVSGGVSVQRIVAPSTAPSPRESLNNPL